MNIQEDFVSFKTAKLLKEKGFPQEYDEYNSMVYNEEDYEDEYEVQRMVLETKLVKAGTLSSYPVGMPEPKCYCPSQAVVMKWLREVHKLHIAILWDCGAYIRKNSFCYHIDRMDNYEDRGYNKIGFDSSEEATEAAIKYCLENLI